MDTEGAKRALGFTHYLFRILINKNISIKEKTLIKRKSAMFQLYSESLFTQGNPRADKEGKLLGLPP